MRGVFGAAVLVLALIVVGDMVVNKDKTQEGCLSFGAAWTAAWR